MIARHEWEGAEYFAEAMRIGEIRGYVGPSNHGIRRPHKNENEHLDLPRLTVTKVLYGQSAPHHTTVQLDNHSCNSFGEDIAAGTVEDLWRLFFERWVHSGELLLALQAFS